MKRSTLVQSVEDTNIYLLQKRLSVEAVDTEACVMRVIVGISVAEEINRNVKRKMEATLKLF